MPGQLERVVLREPTVAQPLVVVAVQFPEVVIRLDQVQPPVAEHEQVDLVPLALAVAELAARPEAERRCGGQDAAELKPSAWCGNCDRVTSTQRWSAGIRSHLLAPRPRASVR